MKKKPIIACLILIYLTSFFSCRKFVEVDVPKTQLIAGSVFDNDSTAVAATRALYASATNSTDFASGYIPSITNLCALSADEFTNSTSDINLNEFYVNTINPNNSIISSLWSSLYREIYYTNSVIEGLNGSKKVSANIKNQLLGEALFMRAFTNFYIVNLFGDAPLVLTTDYKANNNVKKSLSSEIYAKIIEDLLTSQQLLAIDYPSGQRTRLTKWASCALLARVYLYGREYSKAEEQATAVINRTVDFEVLLNLNNVFLQNSREAIFQLVPSSPVLGTWEGYNFILSSAPSSNSGNSSVFSTAFLASFESGDMRKSSWINSVTSGGVTYFYPFKYKQRIPTVLNEYSMVLRLGEQFLIRAEARAKININLSGAVQDLNIIRKRALLAELPLILDQSQILLAVEKERKLELFTEWGHRWFDLKRTSRVDDVIGLIKPNWKAYKALFPIPNTQILRDPAMKDSQNEGY